MLISDCPPVVTHLLSVDGDLDQRVVIHLDSLAQILSRLAHQEDYISTLPRCSLQLNYSVLGELLRLWSVVCQFIF